MLDARPAAATAALGAALVLVAGLLDAEPLYVGGIAFLLAALIAAVWVLPGARGVRLERRIAAPRVLEEEPLAVEVRVLSRRPLPLAALHDDLLPAPAPLPAGRRSACVQISVRFARRGRKVLAPPRVALRDPLGLVTRTVAGRGADEVLVLPRLEAVRVDPSAGDGAGPGTRRGRPAADAETDIDGLRQHRPGTPASRIFWPALARRGELLERRMKAEGDTRPLVVLDPRGAAEPEDLDAAVRAAASLAHHLARRGGCALLLPGDRRPVVLEPGLGAWPQAHARLALVEEGHAPALGGAAGRAGEILYVTARRSARPPRALARAPRGAVVLVVPGALPGRRPAFAVAGCSGYALRGAVAEVAA
ncbi:MAG TPA: DUF58 domain-containing protein [Baekduia sp.]|nr:DUF58 domain-containing protein [Baekduia sp.]